MNMHARAVIAHNGLGHKSSGFAVNMGDIMNGVFHNLVPIGALQQGAKTRANFKLARHPDFRMVYFNGYTLLLEQQTHFRADILKGIDRWYRHITTFGAWSMAWVGAIHIVGSCPWSVARMNFYKRTRCVGVPVNAIKNKKLGFGAKISRIAKDRKSVV